MGWETERKTKEEEQKTHEEVDIIKVDGREIELEMVTDRTRWRAVMRKYPQYPFKY